MMKKSQLSQSVKIGHFMCHEPGSGWICSRLKKQTCVALRWDLQKHEVGDDVGEPLRCEVHFTSKELEPLESH